MYFLCQFQQSLTCYKFAEHWPYHIKSLFYYQFGIPLTKRLKLKARRKRETKAMLHRATLKLSKYLPYP